MKQEENLIRETDASLEQEGKLHILIIKVTSWYSYEYQRAVVVVDVKHLQKSRKCGKHYKNNSKYK